MPCRPRAVSLDLDDTLWPIWPVIERAESALDDFLRRHCPKTAALFPIDRMRALREDVANRHPELAHDFTRQRRISLAEALRAGGEDESHVDAAFEAFYAARNAIEFYPDALDALQRLHAHAPLAALTNGNADLARIGIAGRFQVFIAAREHGHAKPDAPIFHALCDRLGLHPSDVLHVGDDPLLDVHGAQRAGLRACWINRHGASWPEQFPPPDLQFDSLRGLADWMDHATIADPIPSS